MFMRFNKRQTFPSWLFPLKFLLKITNCVAKPIDDIAEIFSIQNDVAVEIQIADAEHDLTRRRRSFHDKNSPPAGSPTRPSILRNETESKIFWKWTMQELFKSNPRNFFKSSR